jgi:hypothetical protein
LLRVCQDIQHAQQGVSRDASPSRSSHTRTSTQARRPDWGNRAIGVEITGLVTQ